MDKKFLNNLQQEQKACVFHLINQKIFQQIVFNAVKMQNYGAYLVVLIKKMKKEKD